MGSNVGDRVANIRSALERLTDDGELILVRESSLYETAPVDYLPQPDFLNNVVEVATMLSPEALWCRTRAVEREFNTGVKIPKGPRMIDIDILVFDEVSSTAEALLIPHPRMCSRKFVLVPLLEIAPDAYCDRDARPFGECLMQINDPSQGIRKYHG